MGVNVIQLRPTAKSVKESKKIIMFPNCFAYILKTYKQKQDELKAKKINFLMQEATQYYYDLLEVPQVSDIDLPKFMYEKTRLQYAREYASRAVLDVIKNNKVDKCYRARIKELRNKKGR